MRKRIYRISEDKFDDLKPNIEFEAEQIEETCFINNTFSGSIQPDSLDGHKLSLHGVNKGSVHGFCPLYTSCLRNILSGFGLVITDIIADSVLSAFFSISILINFSSFSSIIFLFSSSFLI